MIFDFKFRHHEDDEEKTEEIKKLPKWENDFFSIPKEELFETVLAANYFELPTMLDFACLKISKGLDGMMPKDIMNVNIRFFMKIFIKNLHTRPSRRSRFLNILAC